MHRSGEKSVIAMYRTWRASQGSAHLVTSSPSMAAKSPANAQDAMCMRCVLTALRHCSSFLPSTRLQIVAVRSDSQQVRHHASSFPRSWSRSRLPPPQPGPLPFSLPLSLSPGQGMAQKGTNTGWLALTPVHIQGIPSAGGGNWPLTGSICHLCWQQFPLPKSRVSFRKGTLCHCPPGGGQSSSSSSKIKPPNQTTAWP